MNAPLPERKVYATYRSNDYLFIIRPDSKGYAIEEQNLDVGR